MAKYTGTVHSAEQLGRMIQQGRLLQGLTQRELADHLGVTQKYVYEMESGKPTKFATRLFEMMRATGAEMTIELDDRHIRDADTDNEPTDG
ncbi:helix-turn-helix domain-containing protein [Glaciihabitans sp. dw_435]|uniref:helix-turn-helix domain-containing protein n=1 Tax=Glaciihabitans sp. dw_435 TaxID=2720081 RepID=UPI001BD53D21|nr:helix-turn-helix domain-containing protein [Glaciihabitans sp. dw_435]